MIQNNTVIKQAKIIPTLLVNSVPEYLFYSYNWSGYISSRNVQGNQVKDEEAETNIDYILCWWFCPKRGK